MNDPFEMDSGSHRQFRIAICTLVAPHNVFIYHHLDLAHTRPLQVARTDARTRLPVHA